MTDIDQITTLKERLDNAEQQINTLYNHTLNANARALFTRMALSCAIGNMTNQQFDQTIADLAKINESLDDPQALSR